MTTNAASRLARATDASELDRERRHGGKPRRHIRHRSLIASLAAVMVTALAGYMLVANVNLNRKTTVTTNTRELIEKRQDRANELTDDITELSTKLDAAKELSGNITEWNVEPSVQDAGSDTMLPKVEGPGISVQLDDSSYASALSNTSGADVNDYVVHQQDIEAVVNALWAGGAEAMTIQGVRVENTTAVRCVGNVLLLNGHTYSPPYTVQAIGSYDAMHQALQDSSAIQLYLEYVKEDGLGWKVNQEDSLVFEKVTSSLQSLQYAKMTDESQLQATQSQATQSQDSQQDSQQSEQQ
ncbi:MAG: DUF881 domain-containing protein [Bifidobacteriaceae bacterium]|nr:DUF881 domain-containing protein [Bifidobacteriaceae bacterium]